MKVYKVVAVLLTAGDQLPKILLFEVAFKVNVPPEQIGEIGVKVGVILAVKVTTEAEETVEQPLAFVTVTVYDPAVFTINVEVVAPAIFVPAFCH